MNTSKLLTTIALALALGFMAITTSATASDVIADTVTASAAEAEDRKLELLEKSVLFGLDSEYSTIVEKTLYNAVKYKTVYPAFSSHKIEEKLVETVSTGSSHVNRYKAYLTLMFYRHYEEFNTDVLAAILSVNAGPNSLFLAIDETVQVNQLTAR